MCFVRGSAFSGAWKNNFVVFRLSCGAERETLKLFSLWFPSCTFNSHFSLFGKEFHKASKSSRQDGRRCGGAKLYGENYRKLLRPISMTVVWRRKKKVISFRTLLIHCHPLPSVKYCGARMKKFLLWPSPFFLFVSLQWAWQVDNIYWITKTETKSSDFWWAHHSTGEIAIFQFGRHLHILKEVHD